LKFLKNNLKNFIENYENSLDMNRAQKHIKQILLHNFIYNLKIIISSFNTSNDLS